MTTILNIGNEPQTRVNTTVADAQDTSAVTALAGGGYVVTWQNYFPTWTAYAVFAQIYDATGAKIGNEFRVDTSVQDSDYPYPVPSIAALSDGGFIVVWNNTSTGDTNGSGIYAQRYTATGGGASAEFRVNTYIAGDQINPSVTGLSDGGFVVTWTSIGQDGSGAGVYGQRYYANNAPAGGEFRINTTTANDQELPQVTGLSNGGFVVTWHNYDSSGNLGDVFAQIYSAAGTAVGGEFRVNTYTANYQFRQAITSLSDGGFVVTWTSFQQDGDDYGVYAQVYSAVGAPVGGEFPVNSYTTNPQDLPALTGLSDGGFVVTWRSFGPGGDGYDIYAQRYDGEGRALGGEIQINTITVGFQTSPSVAALDDGGFVVTWTDSSGLDGDGNGVYQKVFAAADSLGGTQWLYGTSDSDLLDGGAGGDIMYGGTGDDVYAVNSTSDQVNERAGEGDDTVEATISYTLGNDVENLTLLGSAAINGMGNAGDNVILGNAGKNVLNGLGGGDTIDGGSGNDTINGGAGDDVINGGNGNDVIQASDGADYASGDSGLDTYDVSTGTGAAVIDLNAGKSTQNGYITYLETIENAVGGNAADTITGSTGDNVIDGGAGADTLSGGLGDDTYYIDNSGDVVVESSNASLGGYDTVYASVDYTLANYAEGLRMTGTAVVGNGNSRDNVIVGNAAGNAIDGKAGNDTMTGGLGDDIYWVDSAGDVVVESAGQGADTVRAGLTYTLGANVENLILTGTGNINGTGNAANNQLTGNAGNNALNGLAGGDTMIGGKGDDTYFVDNTGDIVTEADTEGTDIIYTTVTYSLSGRFVETLALTGSANINATGNSRANTLVGNAGNNSLTGGGGADIFSFNLNSHADTITDFNSAQGDSIDATAYHAVGHSVTLSGTSVIIDFGGGNTVTVFNATVSDVTAHTVF